MEQEKIKDTRIPQVQNIENAILIYYKNIELRSKDIRELFHVSSANAVRLKKIARNYILENSIPIWNANMVNTKAAYTAWGLDIKELEYRYKKLKELQPN